MNIPPHVVAIELAKRDSTIIDSSGNRFQLNSDSFEDEFFRRSGQKDALGDYYYRYVDEIQRLWIQLDQNLEKLRKADPVLLYGKGNKLLANAPLKILHQAVSPKEIKWYREMLKLVSHTKTKTRTKTMG